MLSHEDLTEGEVLIPKPGGRIKTLAKVKGFTKDREGPMAGKFVYHLEMSPGNLATLTLGEVNEIFQRKVHGEVN